MVARGWVEEWLLTGTGVSLGDDKNVVNLDYGNVCTTIKTVELYTLNEIFF